MAKSENQKLKLLYIARLLSTRSDDEHTFSVNEIIDYLAENGISAERKSIYDDLELLSLFGYDIIRRKDGAKTGYFLASRDFELAELKILVDSISASKFLSEKKTNTLIKKIEGLTSEHRAKELQRHVFVHDRVKSSSENVYYTVDSIFTAITLNKALRCKYFSYTVTKTRRLRKDGEYYLLSPYSLLWDDENYYLVAWDRDDRKIKHFRVDKMTEVSVTDLPREGKEEFLKLDMPQYQKRVFGMYGGETRTVRLNFDESLAGAIFDRFGTGITPVPEKDGTFSFSAEVGISPTFFSFISTFGGGIRITAPEDVKQKFSARIKAVLKAHE